MTRGLHEFKFKEACTMTGVVVNNAGVIRSQDIEVVRWCFNE